MKCWLFSQAICAVNLKSNGSNLFKVLTFQDAMYCSVVNTNFEKKNKNKKKNSSFSSNLCGITGVVWNP